MSTILQEHSQYPAQIAALPATMPPYVWVLLAQAVPMYAPGDAPGAPGVGLLASASGPVALVGPTVHCTPGALMQARDLGPRRHAWGLLLLTACGSLHSQLLHSGRCSSGLR